jgi:hypothetical protein
LQHICYSVNVAPRVHDMELRHYLDLILRINAQAFSFEASHPRHEHEWAVWKDAKLPDDIILNPGVSAAADAGIAKLVIKSAHRLHRLHRLGRGEKALFAVFGRLRGFRKPTSSREFFRRLRRTARMAASRSGSRWRNERDGCKAVEITQSAI